MIGNQYHRHHMIADLDIKRAFTNRVAPIFFGFSAALTILGIILTYFWEIDLTRLSRVQLEALNWSGAAAAFGIFSLWAGMWLFWVKCDPSSKRARRIWFFILLIGMFGGALAYYFIVYVPSVTTGLVDNQGGRP